MKKVLNNQQGAGHIALILGVIVIVLVGLAGWWVFGKNNDKKDSANNSLASAIQQAVREAKCEYDDQDLCKFFASWKVSDSYSMTSETTGPGEAQSQFSMKVDGQDKTHLTLRGEGGYEVITMGNTTYTKDQSDGKWWKQSLEPTEDNPASSYTDESTPKFAEPDPATVATQYKKAGKEACGGLTCFKYQVIEGDAAVTQYIWFDDKDYQLRRMQHTSEGTTSDTTFAYTSVNITAPRLTKILEANQYIVPGQSKPLTLPEGPTEADMQALMEQYRASQ